MQRREKRGSRGEFMSAGAVYNSDSDLYIAREIPGGPREKLRDNAYANRQRVSPDPALAGERRVTKARKRGGFLNALSREIRKDRVSAVLCAVLFAVFIGLGILYISKSMQIQSDLQAIEVFRTNERFFRERNLDLERKLEQARSATRIRNEALNNLGMLRREKADIREIYIQLPEDTGESVQNTQAETKFELLDALLNLVGIF